MDWFDQYLDALSDGTNVVYPPDSNTWRPVKPTKQQQALIQDSIISDMVRMRIIQEARKDLEEHHGDFYDSPLKVIKVENIIDVTPSPTPTLSVSVTPESTPTSTVTPTLTLTPTVTLTPNPTITPTLTNTLTPVYNLYFTNSNLANPTIITEANEGDLVFCMLEATNIPQNTQVPYTITGISQDDIDLPLTSTLSISYNGFIISADNLTEGSKTMIITLDGITPTVSASLVINDTPTPTYNLYIQDGFFVPQLTADESDPDANKNYRIILLETTNIPDGSEIPYTITGISQDDVSIPLTGNFSVYGGVGGTGFYIIEDFLTEGPETMVITLDGITPTVSAALVINDTSTIPTITPTTTPTETPTPTVTTTPTETPTPTVTTTPTETPTPTVTTTVTQTETLASTPTGTTEPTVTPTISPTNTLTPTITPTINPANTLTPTPSITPTLTASQITYRYADLDNSGGKIISASSGSTGRIYTTKNGGTTWASSNIILGVRDAVCSNDGSKQVISAQSPNAGLYVSDDYGITWIDRTPPQTGANKNIAAVAMNSDGTKIITGFISSPYTFYTSNDFGITWVEKTSPMLTDHLTDLAISSDGQKLVAGLGFTSTQYIYTSPDSGNTWVQRTGAGKRLWRDLTCSSDGSKIIACVSNNESIYISLNSGSTWTSKNVFGSAGVYVTSVAMNDDGSIMYALAGSRIYKSLDNGVTWNGVTNQFLLNLNNVGKIACSSDGLKLTAAGNYGVILSTDQGISWMKITP